MSLSNLPDVAQELSEQNYEKIAFEMLYNSSDSASSAVALTLKVTETSGKNLGLMYGDRYINATLAAQMRLVHQNPIDLHQQPTPRPDTFVFTANSAIPTADAIRGYYAEADEPTPVITTLKCSKLRARQFWDTQRYSPSEYEEIERLGDLVINSRHIVVVEQFCASGRTLRFAAKLLFDAGAQTVSGIRGWWFNQALESDIDHINVTSRHAEFMHGVGATAFKLISTESERFTNIAFT